MNKIIVNRFLSDFKTVYNLLFFFLLVIPSFAHAQLKSSDNIHFQLIADNEKPAFEAMPFQPRMASCYQDKIGIYHLFTDYLSKGTSPYNAVIRHYKSKDLYNWEYVNTVAKHAELGAADAKGCSSPHIYATDEKIYLFYGGTPESVDGKMNIYAEKGETGYMSRSILLAVAKADKNGAPIGNFKKRGVVVAPGDLDDWDAMRLDDPCIVADGDSLHLFFKAFDSNRNLDRVRVGYATGSIKNLKFTKYPRPVLAVPGGGEMPRVFRLNDNWHLFYHHFQKDQCTWQHHTSNDGLHWQLSDPCFFKHTLSGPSDIMMIYGMNGKLLEQPKMLVAGNEDDLTKLWVYHLKEKN